MNDFYRLLKIDFKAQFAFSGTLKFLIFFYAFGIISLSLIASAEEIDDFSLYFIILLVPLSIINIGHNIFKIDFADGSLELLLTMYSAMNIVLARYLTISAMALIALILNIVIASIIYNYTLTQIRVIFIIAIALILITISAITLISSAECYFKEQSKFLHILIFPIIIPCIIFSGLLINSPQNFSYIAILIGIALIKVPLCLFFTSYLIDNIHNH